MSEYEHEREKEHRKERLKETAKHREHQNSENLDVDLVSTPQLMEAHIKMKHPKHIPGWIKTWIIHFLEEIPQQEKEKHAHFDKNSHTLYFIYPQGLDSLEHYLSLDPPNPKFNLLVQSKEQAMDMMRKLKGKKLSSSLEAPEGTLLDRVLGIEINGETLNDQEFNSWKKNIDSEEPGLEGNRAQRRNQWPPRPTL